MKKQDIEEKIILTKATIEAAFLNGDLAQMTSSQAEMRALTILLSRKSPAAPSSSKTRGRKPEKFNEVVEKMRRDQHQGVIIENLKEEALAEQYGASRDTCRKARDKVLSEIVGK